MLLYTSSPVFSFNHWLYIKTDMTRELPKNVTKTP